MLIANKPRCIDYLPGTYLIFLVWLTFSLGLYKADWINSNQALFIVNGISLCRQDARKVTEGYWRNGGKTSPEMDCSWKKMRFSRQRTSSVAAESITQRLSRKATIFYSSNWSVSNSFSIEFGITESFSLYFPTIQWYRCEYTWWPKNGYHLTKQYNHCPPRSDHVSWESINNIFDAHMIVSETSMKGFEDTR
jgi:hypothetical protein